MTKKPPATCYASRGAVRIPETETVADGTRLTRSRLPELVLPGTRLPDSNGFDVIDRLHADPATAQSWLIVCASSVLTNPDRNRLTVARTALWKALTREVIQRALGEAWLTSSSGIRQAPG